VSQTFGLLDAEAVRDTRSIAVTDINGSCDIVGNKNALTWRFRILIRS